MSNPNPGGVAGDGPTAADSPQQHSPATVNLPALPPPASAPPVAASLRYQVVAVAATFYVTPPSLRVTLWPVDRRVPFCLEDCYQLFVDPVAAPAWHIGRIVTFTIS